MAVGIAMVQRLMERAIARKNGEEAENAGQ